MRASVVYCLLSCLAASALAVRHPLHKHRHDKEKRTEVLIVEEDLTVVDIEETIYLPGPPPGDHEHDQGGKNKEHEHKKYPLTTSTLADGSTTVITGPKPTDKGFRTGAGKGKTHVASTKLQTAVVGSGAGEATPSKSTTTGSAATGDSESGSYLTDLLGVPMDQNFAFGHAWGGANFGATIDDTMQQSNFSASLADGPWFQHGEFAEPCWGAPSAKVQIDGYIASGVNKDALHFLWIGANDMNAVQTLSPGDDASSSSSVNAAFAKDIATKIPTLVSKLLDNGAPYVLAANLYPKHLAPLWYNYLGMNTADKVSALGAAISAANVALETALKALPTSNRIIYYDAFTFMSNLYANPGDSFPNIKDTNGWPSFCDGDSQETEMVKAVSGTTVDGVKVNNNWDYCVWLKHQDEWFWMQYVDPTSHVHRLVAQDMERMIKAFSFPG